jgi:hypothetical protein
VAVDETLKCPVVLRWNKAGKRFAICRTLILVDDLPVHLESEHDITSLEMLEFYSDLANDPGWADRA